MTTNVIDYEVTMEIREVTVVRRFTKVMQGYDWSDTCIGIEEANKISKVLNDPDIEFMPEGAGVSSTITYEVVIVKREKKEKEEKEEKEEELDIHNNIDDVIEPTDSVFDPRD